MQAWLEDYTNPDRIPEPPDELDFGGLPLDWLLTRYGEWRRSGFTVLPCAGGYDDQPEGWWIAVNTLEAMLARLRYLNDSATDTLEQFNRRGGVPKMDYKPDFANVPNAKVTWGD